MALKKAGETLTIDTDYYLPTFKRGDVIEIIDVDESDLDQPYKIKSLTDNDIVWIEAVNVC